MIEQPLPKRASTDSLSFTTKSIRRDWPELLAIAGLWLLLGGTAGPVGVIGGVVTAAIWYRFGIPFTLAVGHLLILVVYPDGITQNTFLLIENAFFALVILSVIRTEARVEATVVSIIALIILFGSSWIGYQTGSLWLTAGLGIGTLSVGLYLGHRHALVSLGIVPESESTDKLHSETPQSTDE